MANYQIVSKWNLGKKVDVLSIESISKKKNSKQTNNQSINYSNNSNHSNTIHNSVVLFVFIMISLFLFFSFRSNEIINEESSLNDSTYEINKDIDIDEQKPSQPITHSEKENKVNKSVKELKTIETKKSESQNTEQNNAAKDLTSLSGL